jgi:hypothetical protein
MRPGIGEQDVIEARSSLLGGSRGCSAPEPANLVGKSFRATSAAQDHFMAGSQCRTRDASATVPVPIVPNFIVHPPDLS